MGIPVEYDDNVERQRAHPLLMLKIEPMSLSRDDTKVLKKVEVIVPARVGVRFKKGTKQGSTKLVLTKQKLVPKQRSALDCEKHSPGSGPQWQVNRTRFLPLDKAVL